jgi:UDP-N-acetylmuramoyl-tripeptide--D-alanyl-D-alanine ligase
MKSFFRKKLEWLLAILARATINKYQPSIVGITGTVGKTSTKEAIYAVLKDLRSVRASRGNFNNEIGFPLTILGDYGQIGGIFFWCGVICRSIWGLVVRQKYPEILILEYGIQKPGDMRYLLDIAKPNIAVMTALGDIPAHLEFFANPENLIREKAKLLEAVPAIGFAILNDDDEAVAGLDEKTRAHIMRFGYSSGADVRITSFEYLMTEERPFGIAFKLNYGGSFVPLRFANILGKSHSYASAAAMCLGLIFGGNLVRISENLSNHYVSPKHRMMLIAGINKSFIIDDTYNASPLSMRASLDALGAIKAKRKIGILGDMLELGKFSLQAHESIGMLVGESADLLITVGPQAKFIAEAAASAGGMSAKNVKSFDSVDDASVFAKNLLRAGDLVLVKASRGIGLDKLVEKIKAS